MKRPFIDLKNCLGQAGRFRLLSSKSLAKIGLALLISGLVFLSACNDDTAAKKKDAAVVPPAPVDPGTPQNKPRDPNLPKLAQTVYWDSTPYSFRAGYRTVFSALAASDNQEGYLPTCKPTFTVKAIEGDVTNISTPLKYFISAQTSGKYVMTASCPEDAIFKAASVDASFEVFALPAGSFQFSEFDEPIINPAWYNTPAEATRNVIQIINPSYTTHKIIESTPVLDQSNIFWIAFGLQDNRAFTKSYVRTTEYKPLEDATYFTVVIKNESTAKYLAARMKQVIPKLDSTKSYDVNSVDDLLKMRWNLAGTYNIKRSFMVAMDNERLPIAGFFEYGWEPLADAANPFRGTLKGNGYSLFALRGARQNYDAVSLLGYLDSARVENLIINPSNSEMMGRSNIALLAAIATNSEFENITAGGKVIATTGGGVVGVINNTDPTKVSLKNVRFVGTVDVQNKAGGIVGQMKGSGENLSVAATIRANGYAGGIVGELEGNLNKVTSQVNIEENGSAGSKRGGIAGYAKGKITQAHAAGKISTTGSEVGGLVGNFVGSSGQTIEDSYSSVGIPGTATLAGGLVGKVGPAGSPFVMKRSFVTVWSKERANAIVGDLPPAQVTFEGVLYPKSVAQAGVDVSGTSPIGKDKAAADAQFSKAGYLTSGAWVFDASYNWPVLKNAPVKVQPEAIQ